ncbi:unnamed protein product [Aureobasidium mustum]|uniref:Uncharacterized protein n=1 Tax=Aureobasidium mustum TaxID=2773714 RepID=A0A9N8K592_9PEZI|nr:unnamed protein product [Aureobasidium mustum]
MAAPIESSQAKTGTVKRPLIRLDPNGVLHLGADGVLRSLNADRTAVLDYRRLSPGEINELTSSFDQATVDALAGVDGRDVIDVEQLWAVPSVKTVITDVAERLAVLDMKVTGTHADVHPPWRRDPNGVSHLGADGVLRSLNADRTAVLDYRRLSPEEAQNFASGFDQATVDALAGVDGRDVIDVEQLWAVPSVKSVADESLFYKPAK